MAIQSRVILSGSYGPEHVAIAHDAPSNRAIDPVLEAKIDTEWERQQELARLRGMTLYDASVYRLNRFATEGERLTLHLAPVPYRVHATMKVLHTDEAIREDHVDKVLIADAMIRTRDGVFLFAQIRKLIETTTYLIGGSCTPERQVIGSAGDLWRYMRAKVELILRTGEERVEVGPLLGLIQNEVGCVHAIFDVRVDANSEEILQRFVPGNGVAGLEVVPAGDVVRFLQHGEGYVPSVAPLSAEIIRLREMAPFSMNSSESGVQ